MKKAKIKTYSDKQIAKMFTGKILGDLISEMGYVDRDIKDKNFIDNVYRVVAYTGQYSDYFELCIGIFENIDLARKAVFNLVGSNYKALKYFNGISAYYSPEDIQIGIQEVVLNKEYSDNSVVLNVINHTPDFVEQYEVEKDNQGQLRIGEECQ